MTTQQTNASGHTGQLLRFLNTEHRILNTPFTLLLALTVGLLAIGVPQAQAVTAGGGTITNFNDGVTNWTAHIFTNNGTFSVTNGGPVECLIVGGGGGGGARTSSTSTGQGGGGGGDFVQTNGSVSSENVTIIVGGGGAGASNGRGGNGQTSSVSCVSLGTIQAIGGGGGGNRGTIAGLSGGSGGGGVFQNGAGGSALGVKGNIGGRGGNNDPNGLGGGGGGGATTAGSPVAVNNTDNNGGAGGQGATNSYSGVARVYSSGGGGGSGTGSGLLGGTAGTNAGDGGSNASKTGKDALANYGGGGGGACGTGTPGGNGGSGIVIIRYVTPSSVSVTAPTNNQQFAYNASITATAFVANAGSGLGVTFYTDTNGVSYTVAGTGASPTSTVTLTGPFTPGTYGIYATATNTLQTNAVYSTTNAFTILASGASFPPAIANQAVTDVTTNGATFKGYLSFAGIPAGPNVYVLWGTDTNTWTQTELGTNWLSGDYPSTNMAGQLAPDSTYYYTFGASNAMPTNVVAAPPTNFITGLVTVEPTVPNAGYGGTAGQFTIRRPATCTNEALTVTFSMSGSAVTNLDYTLTATNSVTLAAGQSNAVITLMALPDADTTNEEAVLTVTGGGNYPTGALNSASITISPPPTAAVISNLAVSAVMTNGATFNGFLSSTGRPSPTVVYVRYGLTNGVWTDSAQLDPGTGWTNSSFPSTNIAGLLADRTYYYTFGASNTTAASATTNALASPAKYFITGEVTVEPTVASAQFGAAGEFTIRRPVTCTNEALTVTYAMSGSASNGVDYSPLSGSAELLAGATSVVVTVTVTADGDTTNEHVVLTLTTSATSLYPVGASSNATVAILPYGPSVWTNTVAGFQTWTNSGNWSNSVVPNTVGAVADFSQADIAGSVTNRLGANITVGTIILGDSNGTHPYIIGTNHPSHTLTLDALSGSVVISQAVVSAANVFNEDITLNDDLLIVNSSTTNLTFNQPIAGDKTVTKAGSGTVTLAASNAFTGGLTLNAGTLNINNATALGAAAGTFTIAGGTLDNTSGSAKTNTSNNAQAWNADFTFAGTTNLNMGTGVVTMSASRIVTVSSNTLTLNGVIGPADSANGLTKAGNGTLVLGGLSTYTGLTDVAQGALRYAADNALASGDMRVSGGTLDIQTFKDIVGAVTLTNGSIIGTSGVLTGTTFTVQSGTISAILGGTGANLTKDTSGTVTLSGANLFTGTATINDGTLIASNATALGPAANARVVFADNVNTKTLSLRGIGVAVTELTGGVTSIVENATGSATLTVSNDVSASVFSGVLKDNGGTLALAKKGTDTLTLSGTNTYGGATTNSAGVLNIRNPFALGATNGATVIVTGAALEIQGGIVTTNEALTLNGMGVASGGALRNVTNDNTYAGAITLGSPGVRINSDSDTLTLDVASGNAIAGNTYSVIFGGAGNVTVNDPIATTSGALTKDGAGILTLSGANTYTGTNTISEGVLIANHATALGSAAKVFFTANANTKTLQLNGIGITLVGLSGGDSSSFVENVSGVATLTVTNAGAASFGGVLRDSGGTLALTKGGVGTLTLTGVNTYSGATLVQAGTEQISVSGSIAASPNVTVSTNAILQLDHAIALGSNAVVSLLSNAGASKGTINLNFSGATQMVGRLYFDGESQRPGVTWGSSTSGAMYKTNFFTGNGVLMAGGGDLSVVNLPVTDITTNSATFNGQLWANGNGLASVCVLWGTANGGQTWDWANTNWFDGTSWTNNQMFSTNITGLPRNTVHYYTYAATNSSTNVFATPSIVWGTAEEFYVSTNGTQSGSPVGTTWATAYTNLQDALTFSAGRVQNTIIYLAGGQKLTHPSGGAETDSIFLWQNATNVTLSGGWDTGAAPPTTRTTATILKGGVVDRRVIRMASISNAVIDSVKIQDGNFTATSRGGGVGVFLTNCWDVAFASCIISNNGGPAQSGGIGYIGGGLRFYSGSATLTNTTVIGNVIMASGTRSAVGAGMYLGSGARVTVVRSVLEANSAKGTGTGGGGGGFKMESGTTLDLVETVLRANTNLTAFYGGAGYNNGGTLRMRNCLVTQNKDSAGNCDGLYLGSGEATIINCTIVSNNTIGIQWAAGTVAMTNSIVRGHTTADLLSVPLADVWYSGIGDGQNNGAQGCTSVDPLFVDTTYYHLQSTVGNYTNGYFTGGGWGTSAAHSTLIDLGDTNSPYGREPAPNGARINMGYDGNTEVASLSQTLAAAPPTVTNPGAITWGHRTALLRGQVLVPGSPNPQAYLRYWQVGSGVTNEISKGEQTGAFSATATNLTPGATYQYVAVAINASSNVVSEAQTFAMHPSPSYLYVATNGDNTAGTNWVTAYSDVQTALDLAEKDDTIYLAGHTFAGGTDPIANPHPNNAFLIWRGATNITMRGGYDAVSGGGSDPGARSGTTTVQRTGVTLVRVLSMINVTNSTVEQVRFKGGSGDVVGGGVGLYLTNCASVVFASCSIVNNTALGGSARKGVGMYLQQSSVVMTNCTVADNQQTGDNAWNGGGGVYVEAGSSLTAIRSFLVRNLSSFGGGGGFFNAGVLSLFETVVASNSVTSTLSGAGGYNSGTLLMRNCLVVANDCTGTGGGDGLYLAGGKATVVNCTIVSNSAIGIQWASGTVGVTNSIVWGHSAADATNFPASTGGVLSNVAYSCFGKVFGTPGGDVTAAMANDYANSRCITNDPLFVNAATNNYRLQTEPTRSPAVNAGTNLGAVAYGVADLDGGTRVVDGRVDLGAYEATLYTLTVNSQYGGQSPGTETRGQNAPISQFITNSPFTPPGNTTQYVCFGATVLSNAYTLVNTTNVTMTLTNNATLTWLWGMRDLAVMAGGVLIADGGTNSLGTPLMGTTTNVTLTITNNGTAPLSLSTIVLTGDPAQFTMGAPGTNRLAVGESTTLAVTCTPATAFETIYATVSISNDNTVAASKNPYDIVLTATSITPDIAVRTNGAVLADGGTNDFGSMEWNSTTNVILTITNTGTATLTLGGIAQDGDSVFTLGAPGTNVLGVGEFTTLAVTCTPTAASNYIGHIYITNNAIYVDGGAKNPYDITLKVTGLEPEIGVQEPVGVDLTSGVSTSAFGVVNVGYSSATKTYVVTNSGGATLTLGSVVKGGEGSNDFTVSTGVLSSLLPGSNTQFTVTFEPVTSGVRTASLTIANNDRDEHPFTIGLSGIASNSPLGPFGATNVTEEGSDLHLELHGKAGRTYMILSSNDAAQIRTVRRITNAPGDAFTFIDTNVVGNASITSLYYQVAESNSTTGAWTTNELVWAMEKQHRFSNTWHLITVPVDFGDTNQNSLAGELGQQLAGGLIPAKPSEPQLASKLYVWDYGITNWSAPLTLMSNSFGVATWFDGNFVPASNTISAGQGFWLRSSTADSGLSNTVFTGLTHTNSTPVLMVTNRWVPFAWPYAVPGKESIGNWGFKDQGGHAGSSADNADNIFMQYNGRSYLLWLNSNVNHWCIQNTTNTVSGLNLNNRSAYFYYARGTSFWWKATQP